MSDLRRDLREWVAYLQELGVRELAAPALARHPPRPQAGPPAPSRTAATVPPPRAAAVPPRKPAVATEPVRPAPAPAHAEPQRLLLLEQRGFAEPPPQDPAGRLAEIRQELGECTRCKLHTGRTHIVFGVGNPRARLMFVGEGPGEHEDLQGEPFVGRAGQKLDEMIAAIGLSRPEVYIANVVKCRPPGNREPEPDEIEACSPFLEQQIAAIRPKVIVTLGGPATKLLLRTREGITRVRGHWQNYRGIDVMPTFHPAYLLRNYTRETRMQVWEDLKAARARADGPG
jgi:DNA polymerase